MSRTNAKVADPVVEDTGDLAKLVDQVVEGHTPIIVARDGEPKAALVSMEDYARLKRVAQAGGEGKKPSWEEWLASSQRFAERMLAQRGGKPLEREVVDHALQQAREELEERDSRNAGLGR